MAWVRDATSELDRDRIIGAGCGDRVHAVEYGWLEAIRQVGLFAYRLPADRFRPFGAPEPHAHVAVEPLGPAEPVVDLFQCHAEAGVQLRVLDNLWPFWDAVTTSTLSFSGIRLRNAKSRP
jgi:hypothetical protein